MPGNLAQLPDPALRNRQDYWGILKRYSFGTGPDATTKKLLQDNNLMDIEFDSEIDPN